MPVRVLVSMNAKPGKGSELASLRAHHNAEVRKEPGCEQFDLFQNTENPDQLLIVARWTDVASLEAHTERHRGHEQPGADLRGGPGKGERYQAD
jgi:quinol monooxygenase YgiN